MTDARFVARLQRFVYNVDRFSVGARLAVARGVVRAVCPWYTFVAVSPQSRGGISSFPNNPSHRFRTITVATRRRPRGASWLSQEGAAVISRSPHSREPPHLNRTAESRTQRRCGSELVIRASTHRACDWSAIHAGAGTQRRVRVYTGQ